ncbi:hypothetical protein WN59_08135 [Salinicoccus sediminis]|uniref:Uncharacterized protein n=1 Tax=Salinicoccus sediminis TaxID=1432562 RepID=A0A0M2SIX8_9STAP|nr:hypothetical protein [Salinicoccus sediminis]KKK34238.1 hypothetical protein WN59_08135 [Salinicoccus sediminis]
MAVNPYLIFKQVAEMPAKLYEGAFRTGPSQLMNYGEIKMRLQGAFFAKRHAMPTDEFRSKWQPGCSNA